MGETFVLIKLIYSDLLSLVSMMLILSLSRACVGRWSDQALKSLACIAIIGAEGSRPQHVRWQSAEGNCRCVIRPAGIEY